MKIFNLDEVYNIACNRKKYKTGFQHTANLLKNGISVYKTKSSFLNRTWEQFEYESILKKVIKNYFENKEKEKYLIVISKIRGYLC